MSPSSSTARYHWCVYSDDCFSLSYWVDFFFPSFFLFFSPTPGFHCSSCNAWAYLPCSMWHLSSQTEYWIHITCIGRWILNHWTPGKSRVGYVSMRTHWSSDAKWQESWKMKANYKSLPDPAAGLEENPLASLRSPPACRTGRSSLLAQLLLHLLKVRGSEPTLSSLWRFIDLWPPSISQYPLMMLPFPEGKKQWTNFPLLESQQSLRPNFSPASHGSQQPLELLKGR